MQQPPAPFSCNYSPNVPELLSDLHCTVALTTYQAGKLIFLSPSSRDSLVQLPRQFDKAMGMAFDGKRLAVASRNEVLVMADAPALAAGYPPQPNTYDHIFVPRAIYFAGEVDLHDMEWGADGLIAVNTRFSCLAKINDSFSFEPMWQPHFITDLEPADRCHLNGMVMVDGKPKYVTALGNTNETKAWRPKVETGGILMDVDANEIVAANLPMPHSPRVINGELYVLLSATGQLAKVDVQKGSYEVIAEVDGFVRGLDVIGDYLFIGLSRLRKNSSTFRDLPIAQRALSCGVDIFHLPTALKVGEIRYQASVEELYDVKILKGMLRPGVMSHQRTEHRNTLATPTDAFWASRQNDNSGEVSQGNSTSGYSSSV